jgi:hypothetical protein
MQLFTSTASITDMTYLNPGVDRFPMGVFPTTVTDCILRLWETDIISKTQQPVSSNSRISHAHTREIHMFGCNAGCISINVSNRFSWKRQEMQPEAWWLMWNIARTKLGVNSYFRRVSSIGINVRLATLPRERVNFGRWLGYLWGRFILRGGAEIVFVWGWHFWNWVGRMLIVAKLKVKTCGGGICTQIGGVTQSYLTCR